MPLLNQVAGSEPRAVAVIQRHAALLEAGQDAVNQHHAGDLLHQRGQLVVGDNFGMNHQRSAAVADQLFNRLTLFMKAVIAVADQQKIAGIVGNLLDGFDHRAEEGVGDITHHQADGFR